MNKKLFKMPILFALILCICFVFVGCGQQAISSKDTPPEGVSQEVYDDTLKLLQEVGEHLKEGNSKGADKIFMEYEKKYTGDKRPGETPTDKDVTVIYNTTALIDNCISYVDIKDGVDDGWGSKGFYGEKSIKYMQEVVNALKKGYTIDIQENKIVIEETKR